MSIDIQIYLHYFFVSHSKVFYFLPIPSLLISLTCQRQPTVLPGPWYWTRGTRTVVFSYWLIFLPPWQAGLCSVSFFSADNRHELKFTPHWFPICAGSVNLQPHDDKSIDHHSYLLFSHTPVLLRYAILGLRSKKTCGQRHQNSGTLSFASRPATRPRISPAQAPPLERPKAADSSAVVARPCGHGRTTAILVQFDLCPTSRSVVIFGRSQYVSMHKY
jgi:hypothetical protein